MGLDISAAAKQKQKQQEYAKKNLAKGVLKKIRTQICDDKHKALEGQ